MNAAPLVALTLLLVSLHGAPVRSVAVIGAAAVLIVAIQFAGGRGVRAALGMTAGVLALASGLIADAPVAAAAGAIWLVDGVVAAWGINRGRSRRNAWFRRGVATGGALLVTLFVIYPTLQAV